MLEKYGSPRYKITRIFRDLISREFSPCKVLDILRIFFGSISPKLTQKTENNTVGRFGSNLDSKFYLRKQFFRAIGESGRGFGLEVMKISKFIRFPSVYKNSLSISGLVCHYPVHCSA